MAIKNEENASEVATLWRYTNILYCARLGCGRVTERKKNDKIAETKGAQRRAQVETIWIKFGIRVLDVPGAIKCANFGDDSLKGFWSGDQISPFLIGFRRCYDNTLALPCKCVDWCTS